MSSLPSGFEPIEASGAEPAWQISAQLFVEEAQTSTAIYYTENRQYQEVTKKSPESPWSNYIRKEISRNFQDKVKGKTDKGSK